jgi:hypothetical protein
MAELKNLTVQALRDLARKVLGPGHSKLKTKGELVAALQAAGKNVSGAAGKAAARLKKATGRAAEAASKAVATRRAKAAATRGVKDAGKKPKAKPAPEKAAPAAKPKAPARARGPAAPARSDEPAERVRRDEPDAEGYFVARVRGEDAVRDAPHPMTEGALEEQRAPAPPPRKGHRPARRFEEHLGELPSSYDEDRFFALPRDPRTLFFYWDHHAETLRNGFEGLEGAKAQLWILARTEAGGWERIRTIDFALESRSWYVHDLEPGRTYRGEIHLVDRHGRAKRLTVGSNEMQLPPFGPSRIIDDRFMRIPWSEPLTRLLRHVREGEPFPEELRALLASLSDWSRFVAPALGSGSGAGAAAAGGPGGRPSGPSGAPTSPSSPFGPFGYGSGSGEGR